MLYGYYWYKKKVNLRTGLDDGMYGCSSRSERRRRGFIRYHGMRQGRRGSDLPRLKPHLQRTEYALVFPRSVCTNIFDGLIGIKNRGRTRTRAERERERTVTELSVCLFAWKPRGKQLHLAEYRREWISERQLNRPVISVKLGLTVDLAVKHPAYRMTMGDEVAVEGERGKAPRLGLWGTYQLADT